MPSLQGREISADGLSTYIVEQGDGQPVVMLHGMASTSDCWVYVFKGLGGNYRLIAPDMPGHGRSAGGNHPYSLDFYATWLEGLLDSLNIKRAVLIGNSMGGGVTLAFALAHPERVKQLVLVDALGLGDSIPWKAAWHTLTHAPHALAAQVTGKIDPYLLRFFEGWICVDPWGAAHDPMVEIMRVNLRKGFWSFAAGMRLLIADFLRPKQWRDFAGRAVRITIPTLVAWGRYDELLPLAHGVTGAERIPSARLILFDQSGHTPMMEEPEKFNAAVREFLNEGKPKTGRGAKKIGHRRVRSTPTVRR